MSSRDLRPEKNEVPAVTLYTRAGCHLCEVAAGVLASVQRDQPFTLTVVDVDTDGALAEEYGLDVPVVSIDGREAFKLRVDAAVLRERLAGAASASVLLRGRVGP